MPIFAFMDCNAGFYQSSHVANDKNEAIRAYAAHVGLIEEIKLDLFIAEVSSEQLCVLEQVDSADMTDKEQSTIDIISWKKIGDADVREILGFGPREELV